MKVCEIFLQTTFNLDLAASNVRRALRHTGHNPTLCQLREGINRGGLYYLFEGPDFVIEMMSNAGEVLIDERSEWQYYLIAYSEDGVMDDTELETFMSQLCSQLNTDGLKAEIDSLH